MLTERMRQCLSAIEDIRCDRGVAPSYDELKDMLGLKSKAGIHRMILALEERGYLRRIPGRARALEIIKPQTGPSPDYLRGFADGAEAERRKMDRGTALALFED